MEDVLSGSLSDGLRILVGSMLFFWLVGVACDWDERGSRRPALILEVVDQASNPEKKIKFDKSRARRYLERALGTSKVFSLSEEDDPDAYRARLRIVLASEREAGGESPVGVYRAVQVDLEFKQRRSQGGDRVSAVGKQFLVQDPGRQDRDDGFDAVLEMAIHRAVDVADLQMDLRTMERAALRQVLHSEQLDRRLMALRTLQQRKEPELVPEMIELLGDPDSDVVIEAVGALVFHKDQRAARPLIKSTNQRDSVYLLQIITALGELGGVDAKGFLFTLAAGHQVESIRRRAHEVYVELEATEPRIAQMGRVVALPKPVHKDGRVK